MKLTCFIATALLACFTGRGQENGNTAKRDTTQIYILNINGKDYEVRESEPLKLTGTFSNPVVKVRTPAYKKFNGGKVSFDFPKHMSMVVDASDNLTTWTINGNDFEIMLFELGAGAALDDLVQEVEKQYGKDNCIITPIEGHLGGKTVGGKKMEVTMAGQKLIQEFLQIKLPDEKLRVLVFQDSPGDNGKHTKEYTLGRAVVEKTIVFH